MHCSVEHEQLICIKFPFLVLSGQVHDFLIYMQIRHSISEEFIKFTVVSFPPIVKLKYIHFKSSKQVTGQPEDEL